MPAGARAVAAALGLVRYFTGKPCPAGHFAERYVSTGNCSECQNRNAAIWHNKNRDHSRSYARERYWKAPAIYQQKNRDWYALHSDRSRKACQDWHKRNPLARVVHKGNRRARIKKARGTYTAADISALQIKQKYCCAVCFKSIRQGFHIDHWMPIALGGHNDVRNLKLLCQPCNQRKYAKDPITFAQENGRLL